MGSDPRLRFGLRSSEEALAFRCTFATYVVPYGMVQVRRRLPAVASVYSDCILRRCDQWDRTSRARSACTTRSRPVP